MFDIGGSLQREQKKSKKNFCGQVALAERSQTTHCLQVSDDDNHSKARSSAKDAELALAAAIQMRRQQKAGTNSSQNGVPEFAPETTGSGRLPITGTNTGAGAGRMPRTTGANPAVPNAAASANVGKPAPIQAKPVVALQKPAAPKAPVKKPERAKSKTAKDQPPEQLGLEARFGALSQTGKFGVIATVVILFLIAVMRVMGME